MSDLFIAVQRGVYRHAIVGACSTLERAKELGSEAILIERDHYHSIEIVRRAVDGRGEETVVGTLRPRIGRATYPGVSPWGKSAELLGIDWEEATE